MNSYQQHQDIQEKLLEPNVLLDEAEPTQSSYRNFLTVLRICIPILLLLAGIAVLYLRIPIWSIVLGLPLVTIGSTLSIKEYDELVTKTMLPTSKNIKDKKFNQKNTDRQRYRLS